VLDNLVGDAALLDIVVQAAGQAVSVGNLEATAALADLTLSPGAVSIDLDVLEAVATLLNIDFGTIFTGPLSIPMNALRVLIANTSEFQTWTGTGDADAAAGRIYLAGVDADDATRPFAVISHGARWEARRYAGGARNWFLTTGSLRVLFEAAIDAGDVDDHEDAESAFLGDVGGIMSAALDLSGSDDYLSLDTVELEFGPARSDEDEAEDYYQARFECVWGPT
jgi:hypothetical protein